MFTGVRKLNNSTKSYYWLSAAVNTDSRVRVEHAVAVSVSIAVSALGAGLEGLFQGVVPTSDPEDRRGAGLGESTEQAVGHLGDPSLWRRAVLADPLDPLELFAFGISKLGIHVGRHNAAAIFTTIVAKKYDELAGEVAVWKWREDPHLVDV